MFRQSVLVLLLGGLLNACGPKGAQRTTPPTAGDSLRIPPGAQEALTLPPGDDTRSTLRKLEELGDQGLAEAAWIRAHYLMDLFDAVRFAGDEASRELLATIAGRPVNAMSGPAATQAIAELVVLEADRVLELDRNHSAAQSLRLLAAYDSAGPTTRDAVFQTMQELRRVRYQKGPLARSATLRLFGYCKQALIDAEGFARRPQRVALSHCLYPLYSADPEPYFDPDPALRPPPPEPSVLMTALAALVGTKEEFRLRKAFDAQASWIANFSEKAQFLVRPDPVGAGLATSQGAVPYDDRVIMTAKTDPQALAKELVKAGERAVAIALPAQAAASQAYEAGEIAAKAGASSLKLLVATQQRLRVPSGDYWSARAKSDEDILTLGEIGVSLALLKVAKAGDTSESARASEWNRQHSELVLHLVVTPTAWTLLSPGGVIETIAVGDADSSAPERLQEQLVAIRQAYPDEQGLVLVPKDGASIGALVLAATAARSIGASPLFPRLALAKDAPKAKRGTALRSRIARRARVDVKANPESLGASADAAKRCAQDLANRKAAPVGEVRLELSGSAVRATSGAAALRTCAVSAFAPEMKETGAASAVIEFTAKAK